MSDPREATLEELERRLQDLLSAFEVESELAPDAAADRVEGAWLACTAAFERFRDEQERSSAPPPDVVREGMERVLKLNAVAAGVVSRCREALSTELARVSDVRSRLPRRGASEPEHTGGSCDLTG